MKKYTVLPNSFSSGHFPRVHFKNKISWSLWLKKNKQISVNESTCWRYHLNTGKFPQNFEFFFFFGPKALDMFIPDDPVTHLPTPFPTPAVGFTSHLPCPKSHLNEHYYVLAAQMHVCRVCCPGSGHSNVQLDRSSKKLFRPHLRWYKHH